MSSVTEVVTKGLLFPLILLVLTKFLDGYGKYLLAPRPLRKYRFDKVPTDTKVKVLAKINALLMMSDKLRDNVSSAGRMVQIKFLYEQAGIYLPVWHCHQLIAFMAAENICSLDARLNGFLNNTFIGLFPAKGFSLNSRLVTRFYVAVIIYGLVFLAVLASVWWYTTPPFLGLRPWVFVLCSLIYFVNVIFLVRYSFFHISEVRQGVKFCRLFETWLCHNVQQNDADTSRSHKSAHEGSDG